MEANIRPSLTYRLARRSGVLWALAVFISAILVLVSRWIYAEWTNDSFLSAMAGTLIELAVIGVLGTAFSQLISATSDVRAAEAEERDRRLEFLRRIRAAHIQVATAQKMLKIHSSPRMYQAQHHELIRIVPTLEEIELDLDEAAGLFGEDQKDVICGLRNIISYLREAETEFETNQTTACQNGYTDTAELPELDCSEYQLTWTIDFASAGAHFQERYDRQLTASKGKMRKHVFTQDRAVR